MASPPLPTPGDTADPSSSSDPSYIDYEAFLSPSFHPPSFANTLVLATNNPSDTPLDLSTPLSRVLFDIQEIDSHIHTLTTRSALPLLDHTTAQTAASTTLLASLQAQLTALNETHATLAREVSGKYTAAEEVRAVASRLHAALRLCRAVSRYLTLARQLEAQLAELTGAATATTTTSSSSARAREDHRALTRCAHTLLSLSDTLTTEPGLDRVTVLRTARDSITAPAERTIRDTAERMVREFSLGTAATFSQGEESRARTVSALSTLYLLSPTPQPPTKPFTPTLMLHALDSYLRAALQSSIASLSRALATLPSLDRTLAEISARCQNVVALEAVLDGTRAPAHPLLPQQQQQQKQAGNLLQPLLAHLETGSLPSYFWRTLAGSMAPRVQEIVTKGGLPARTLRANRQAVGEAVTECVRKGCRLPSGVAAAVKGGKGKGGSEEGGRTWEREVAVMVGSIVNNLGR